MIEAKCVRCAGTGEKTFFTFKEMRDLFFRGPWAALWVCVLVGIGPRPAAAQAGDCVYPVIFIHGWTGSQDSFASVYGDPAFAGLWGALDGGANDHVYHAVLNATTNTDINGPDGILGTSDDDVLVSFVEDQFGQPVNDLQPGCVYAINFENFWNEDPNNPVLDRNGGDSPGFTESDSNEAAILKQGYALGKMIEAVLAANPAKEKVVLVGHSMGGLAAREYLQRRVPETPGGTPRWWVDPSSEDGHRVARLLTMGTPHRGSNLLGNTSEPRKDALPDPASEAVRDLRYSYACGFLLLDDCSAPYLFGGDEGDIPGFPFPFWNDDVNCDGDESDVLPGINVDGATVGAGDPWDGTYDNPNMPLPTNVRYTWYTSDSPGGGADDDVVDLDRQYIYEIIGGEKIPVPNDGVSWRLSDTLKTDLTHLDENDDVDGVARGIDEGDYPAHAWKVALGPTYAALPQWRSEKAPDGAPRDDPDWYLFTLDADAAVTVTLTPTPGLSGRLDLYETTPDPYDEGDGTVFATFDGASGTVSLASTGLLAAGAYYVRVRHEGVGLTDWHTPYLLSVDFGATPDLELTVTPLNPPIEIPPEGGRFDFTLTLTNNTTVSQTVDVWFVIANADAGVSVTRGPYGVTVGAGGSFSRTIGQNVPGGAPAGDYTFTAHAGDFPVADVSDSFAFTKLAAAKGGPLVYDWNTTASGRPLVAHAVLDAGTDDVRALPRAFTLSPNFPNPFNPRTTFTLTVAESQRVTVAVFDVLGRRVALLHDGLVAAGAPLRFTFDAGNLPSGVYLYRADGERFSASRRMTLLK